MHTHTCRHTQSLISPLYLFAKYIKKKIEKMTEERKEGREGGREAGREEGGRKEGRCNGKSKMLQVPSSPWAMRVSRSQTGSHVADEKQRAACPRQGAVWRVRDQDK